MSDKMICAVSRNLALLFESMDWRWGHPGSVPTAEEIEETTRHLIARVEAGHHRVETGRLIAERDTLGKSIRVLVDVAEMKSA